ncbi:MAG: lecithin retinol acyltransferase family protein [Rudanella sp.]|nr:lecithin retinol acyltransferase family protein [Rudanella sp.]
MNTANNFIALTANPLLTSPACLTANPDQLFVYSTGLQIGDRVVRRKSFGTTHHGIYAGISNGQPIIAENQRGFGVRYVTLSEFLLHDFSSLHHIEPITNLGRVDVLPVIEKFLGTPYNLVTFNCEHFAHLIQHGRARSVQAQVAWGIFLFFVSSLLASVS